ncbi:MAG: carboxypeptidase regulatory-like domain-containing protein, partial [Verrucomicrobia bacterium]|nr:carboxypeptidase regulatory-like domain-containing protein [Verrucomicrobiota bacterium]
LEVSGLRAAREQRLHPTSVRDIPVGRKATRLHVIHGAGEIMKDGTPVAKLVLHYANGQEHTLSLVYGQHLRNWYKASREPDEVTNPNSKVVWTGTSPRSDRYGMTLRLYRTSFPLPLPDVELRSLDVVSLLSESVWVTVGMTLEEAGAGAAPEATAGAATPAKEVSFDEAALRAETRVQVLDIASRKPIPDATIKLNVNDGRSSYFFGEHKADAQGRATLDFPPKLQQVTLQVRAPGYVATRQEIAGDELPREVTVRLARGLEIGGVVKDEAGKPIAGAKVKVNSLARDEVGQVLMQDLDVATTDAQGKWTSGSTPANPTGLNFKLTHAEFTPAEYDQATPDNPTGNVVTLADLQAGTAVMVMQPGITVEGSIANDQGQPVAGAEVLLASGENFVNRWTKQSDAQGRFKLVILEPGDARLIVQATGYAPQQKPISVERGLGPVAFKLAKGAVLKGRIVDGESKPVEGASISVASWADLPLLNWRASSDAEGRFTWDGAPTDVVTFSISKPGFSPTMQEFSAVSGHELTARLERTFLLTGKVVDAETKEPIMTFRVVPGYAWDASDEGQVNWETQQQTYGLNGNYSITLEPRPGPRVKFMAVAEGYLPVVSPLVPATGSQTFDFLLKKGKGPKGVVQSPGGKPVEGAQVAIQGMGYLSLANAKLKVSGEDETLTTTDAQGRFSLPALLVSPTIVAVHELGFAEVNAEELATSGKVQLLPWGTVSGVMKRGKNLATNETIMLTARSSGPGGLNFDWEHFKVQTDEQGRFVFTHVPPGERQLVRLIQSGPSPWMSSHLQPVLVEAGVVTRVTYGGTGRPVIGRIVLSDPKQAIDWSQGHHSLSTKWPQPPKPFTKPEEWREWNTSPEVKTARARHRSYAPQFVADGSFRIDDVPAGEYQLQLMFTEPGAAGNPGMGRPIGSISKEVVVPEIPEGRSDEPLDLGELKLQLRIDIRAGSTAPALEVKTLDGKSLKLADYRGKFVLLNFWATWSPQSVAEVAELKSIYDTFAKDDRLVMLSLSLDQQASDLEDFIKKHELKWLQGHLGEWSKTQVPAAWSVEGIPATFFIDPEGKIIAKEMRVSAIRGEVEKALRAKRASTP